MKSIVILGSTGSVGRNALDVIAQFPALFKVQGLAAGKNIGLLKRQIVQFEPTLVAVSDPASCSSLKKELSECGINIDVLCGSDGVNTVAAMREADTVISAIVGSSGLLPTLAAVRSGKHVALANKETLVMAGDIINAEVKKSGARILPVDSEHSALFQCMNGCSKDSIKRLILTASGGPFFGRSAEDLTNITPSDALRHPKWQMGRKISIDSATLMNKGLEVIEARALFDIPLDKIDVLIHPQSIVHSIVEFADGSCMAQLSNPDMKGPIAYALSYPERLSGVMEPLAWEKLSGLTFHQPDTSVFDCLPLAYAAAESGGTMPAVLNAANEVLVYAFLDGLIGFTDIPAIIKKVMNAHTVKNAQRLDTVLEADRWARIKATEVLEK